MIVESGNPGPAEAEALRNEVRRLRCGPEDLMDPGTRSCTHNPTFDGSSGVGTYMGECPICLAEELQQGDMVRRADTLRNGYEKCACCDGWGWLDDDESLGLTEVTATYMGQPVCPVCSGDGCVIARGCV